MKIKSLLQENVQLDEVDSPNQLEGITDVVDVTGNVNLSFLKMTSLPAKFGKVGGNFDCSDNDLVLLAGSPTYVGGYFSCVENELITLNGCPTKVGANFSCYDNQLTSLEGCPTEVGRNFSCSNNRLTSLVGIHKLVKKINGNMYFYGNPIKEGGIGLLLIDGIKEIKSDHLALDIISKYVSQGKMGILACQEELIEAGYEAFAKL